MAYRVLVSDLLSKPGSSRAETGTLPLDISITNAHVHGQGAVDAKLQSLSDGLVARGAVSFDAVMTCNRCLTEWIEPSTVDFEQIYRFEPQDLDEELGIENGVWIDLERPVRDEVTLSLPTVPVCRTDCRGLCPTCGADLNTDACNGHPSELDSPFAALEHLFED